MDKQNIQERQQEILDLIKEFCEKKIDQEHFELSKKVLEKLTKSKDVIFTTSKPQTWAAAVLHALGTINFLFDKSFEPYVSVGEINDFFDVKKTTLVNKSKQIRDLLKMKTWSKGFSTKAMAGNNPLENFIMIDGVIVPLDSLLEEYQIIIAKARLKGK